MLTRFLIRAGLTRDHALWLWLKIVGIAGLIAGGGLPLQALGLSVRAVHWLLVGSAIVAYLGGQYSTSGLPSTTELQSVKLPKERP